MAESKLVVPDGMLKAALKAEGAWLLSRSAQTATAEGSSAVVLQEALLWLSGNPIVPTDEQAYAIEKECPYVAGTPSSIKWYIEEWQRHVFFAPCPLEERVTVEKWVHDPSLWIVLRDGWNSSGVPGFKDKKDAEIYRLGLIQKLKEEKGAE